jgi:quercetin dioxygenase-like cupin family protein
MSVEHSRPTPEVVTWVARACTEASTATTKCQSGTEIMNEDVFNYIVRTVETEWKPLVEGGVNTSGIFLKPLRVDQATGRAPTFLLRFEPGAKYPYHDHPAGEELFVLSGSCVIEGATLAEGDYLYTPPGSKHSVRTDTGCTLLFQVPAEVVIL